MWNDDADDDDEEEEENYDDDDDGDDHIKTLWFQIESPQIRSYFDDPLSCCTMQLVSGPGSFPAGISGILWQVWGGQSHSCKFLRKFSWKTVVAKAFS